MFRLTLVLAFSVTLILEAQEGNYKYENFGNQSVLLNGNVTGSVADLGLTYYNPARLALIENPSFTIGGKAFEWSKYTFDNVLDSDRDLETSNFGGLSATIAGTFSLKFLPDHKFAYSIITRQRSNVEVSYDSGVMENEPIRGIDDAIRSFIDVSLQDKIRDDWFGISWAYAINDKFGIGASLFGSLYDLNGRGEILITAERENGDVVSYTDKIEFDQKTYGLFFRVGTAWQLSGIDMGVNISLPFLNFNQRASFNLEETLSGLGAAEDFFTLIDLDELDGNRKTAIGISYGAGIPWKKSKIHLSVDWFSRVNAYQRIELPEITETSSLQQNIFVEELRSVVNFGAGAEIYVSPSVNIITSFSSDFSATEASANLFDAINQSEENINLLDDFWHFSLGTDLNLNFGNIVLGASYSSTSSQVDDGPDIPIDGTDPPPNNVVTNIGFERWRFIIGLEIPLLQEKLKNLPIK